MLIESSTVINADDFYGAPAYRKAAGFLDSAAMDSSPATFALAGYRRDKTLSDHGTVARLGVQMEFPQ